MNNYHYLLDSLRGWSVVLVWPVVTTGWAAGLRTPVQVGDLDAAACA